MKVSFQRTKKRRILPTLRHSGFSICCDFKTFHFEIDHLKTILMKNNYHPSFIDKFIKSFLNKLYGPKVIVQNLPKRNAPVKLPFLVSTSLQIRKKLQKLFSDKLTSCNLKIVFTSPVRVKSFFFFKDKLPKILISWLIYKYKCSGCNATYYGKTNHHFKVRFSSFEDFSILTKKINYYKLRIMETLQIAGDKSVLNKAYSSLPLELFICTISGYVFITSYDVHLSHCAYTIAVCSVFSIMLLVLSFIKNRMLEHLISF